MASAFCAFLLPWRYVQGDTGARLLLFLFYFIYLIIFVILQVFYFSSLILSIKKKNQGLNEKNWRKTKEMKKKWKKNSKSSRKKWKKPSFLFSHPTAAYQNGRRGRRGGVGYQKGRRNILLILHFLELAANMKVMLAACQPSCQMAKFLPH